MTGFLHHLRIRNETGAALVEFALAVPVLMLLLFGALDLGKAYNYWIDETHLAHEGARYAAVDKNPGPGSNLLKSLRQQVDTTELRDGGTSSVPSALKVCVDFPNSSSNVGDPVRVKVETTYKFMSFLAGRMSITDKTITADSTMRLEKRPTYTAGCEVS